MNEVQLLGRLTKAPEVRYTAGEKTMAVASYTLAVNRQYKKDGQPSADFIRCVAFGKKGETAEKYLKKGMQLCVVGHIQTGSFKDNDGKTVYTTDVIVDKQHFVGSKKDNEQNADVDTAVDNDDFVPVDEDDDGLPF